MTYVMTWNHHKTSEVRIITGFTSRYEANEWGQAWSNAHKFSPCWVIFDTPPVISLVEK